MFGMFKKNSQTCCGSMAFLTLYIKIKHLFGRVGSLIALAKSSS